MLNKEELIHYIRQYCIENTNIENALKFQRYFKEANDSYGLTQPQMNEKAKSMIKDKLFAFETLLSAAPELLKGNKYEEVTMTILLVNGFEKQYNKQLFTEISSWFEFSIHNWAHADGLAMFILPKFFKNNIINDSDFIDWKTSTYKFQRRCIPVTFIKTLKTRNNFQPLFDFLQPLLNDPAREVHQGMGWFLRECWKIKPKETEEFLIQFKDVAPRLIIQYATEKMIPEQKLLFKRAK